MGREGGVEAEEGQRGGKVGEGQGRIKHLVGSTHFTMPGPHPAGKGPPTASGQKN